VQRWVDVAERALDAARGMTIRAIQNSPRAQEESVSLPLPAALKRPTARFGTFMLTRKWDATLSDADATKRLSDALEELRAALGGKTDGYLDSELSFADIAMSGVVQAIAPVSDRFLRLGPATRAAWTRPDLVARFGDLIAWRDGLYEKHRTQPS
jgi:glutathione S-transferase